MTAKSPRAACSTFMSIASATYGGVRMALVLHSLTTFRCFGLYWLPVKPMEHCHTNQRLGTTADA